GRPPGSYSTRIARKLNETAGSFLRIHAPPATNGKLDSAMRRARIGADDAIKLRLRSEVQQKAYLETRSAQVIQKLPRGGSMQLRCRFDLDYQHIVDDQVEPLRAE